MKKSFSSNPLNFQNIEEIYFPSNCLICGDETEKRFERTAYGSFIGTKDFKKDYYFKLPVCEKCTIKINLKTGLSSKAGIILFLSSLCGISLSILFYFITYSILLSIAIFTVLIVFPYIHYKAYIKPKIKLSDFFQLKINSNGEIIQFNIKNSQFANFVNKINSDRQKEKAKSDNAEKTNSISADIDKVSKDPKEDNNGILK